MQLLERIQIAGPTYPGQIELYEGDLTELPDGLTVDYLVVSAFPDDYAPIPGTLIGALHDKGLSVGALAERKAVDLREACSCWLSAPLKPRPGMPYKRLLCFEPAYREPAPQVIGDVFRSLVPFLALEQAPATVAMPLLASGNQRAPYEQMQSSLIHAAAHWIHSGLPLGRLVICEHSDLLAGELAKHFRSIAATLSMAEPSSRLPARYDYFLSYAHADAELADIFAQCVMAVRPTARLFVDRFELDPGCAWQQRIYDAIETAGAVVALYSPAYVQSAFCQEEFNIALFRQRRGKTKVLPIYLHTAPLPTYMEALVQYVDCREGDARRIREAAHRIASFLPPPPPG